MLFMMFFCFQSGWGQLNLSTVVEASESVECIVPSSEKYQAPQSMVFKNDLGKKYVSCFEIDALPFFCRIEEQVRRNSRFPIKVRLGSVDYVDKLESK